MDAEKLKKVIIEARRRFPKEQYGGCYLATRWMIEQLPELREHSFKVGTMPHCVAILPDERIVDTQMYQFGLVRKLPDGIWRKSIFTREEYEKVFPEYDG